MTLATKYWEKFGFLCFVMPFQTHYFRIFGVVGFWALHLAFGSALRIGTGLLRVQLIRWRLILFHHDGQLFRIYSNIFLGENSTAHSD